MRSIAAVARSKSTYQGTFTEINIASSTTIRAIKNQRR